MKRKLFGSLMCTVVLCLFMCIAVLAEGGSCGKDLEWDYDGSTRTLTITGSGEMDDYVFGSYKVGVNSPWNLSGNSKQIKKVQINEGVTSIGQFAFFGCSNLTNISIPSSVQSIGKEAFSYCSSLNEITIPLGVETLPSEVFTFCRSLTTVYLPISLRTIEEFAFQDCSSLTRLDLPSGLMSIGMYIFQNCEKLKDVYYDGTSIQWDEIPKHENWRNNAPDFTMHFHYTVSFDANGHGTAPDAQSGLWTPALVTDPGNPTASGYNFTGWYKDKDCTQKWDFSNDTVEGDMTLYAGWEEVSIPDPTPDQKQDPAPTSGTSSGSISDPTLGNLSTLEEKAVGLKEKDSRKNLYQTRLESSTQSGRLRGLWRGLRS